MSNVRKYSDIYKSGKENGFIVDSARQYYSQNDSKKPKLDVVMNTPYSYLGRDVTARATIDLNEQSRSSETGLRDASMVEFYVGNSNLDYDAGFDVTDEMRQTASDFAASAAEYPHVFMYDEYVEARTPINERMKLGVPTEQDYNTYLESMDRQLHNSRDFEFIGQITKPSDLNTAYASTPSFSKMMDDAASTMSENERQFL